MRALAVICLLCALGLLVGHRNSAQSQAPASGIDSAAEAQQIGSEVITEDDPRWDCRTMGNGICGNTERGKSSHRMYNCPTAVQYGDELDIDFWC